MGQGDGLGQMYNVQNEIKLSKSTGWGYIFIMTFFFTKQCILIRRSTVLSLPLQKDLPGWSLPSFPA